MLASEGGHLDVAKLLIAKGSLMDAVNNDGWTALMRALEERHPHVAELLI